MAAYLTQALFAVNEMYFLRDKRVMDTIAQFPNRPANYVERLEQVLSGIGGNDATLAQSVAEVEALWCSVVSLPGVDYRAKFMI